MANQPKGPNPGKSSGGDDLWSVLLSAAENAAANRANVEVTSERGSGGAAAAPGAEESWAQLLNAAAAEASRSPEEASAQAEPGWGKGSVLLGTYRIEAGPIHGGMGSVWRVHHTGWDVDLAMKRPQPKLFSTPASKQGFIDECQNWINLGMHPNVVSCYYVREIAGVPAIFSEWMENGSLKERIDDGSLYNGYEEEVRERLLDIAIQFARGLRHAHDNGLIHQDVKPANLLLNGDWEAKVADFGLANARAQLTVLEGSLTQLDAGESLNAAAGGYTPAYCSMEQMDGRTLTRRTDIYSWAVSVMEMYCGSRPWQNGVVAGVGCREYMAEARVAVPEKLQDLLARCMDPDPDRRPHDFETVEKEMADIYRRAYGEEYAAAPKAAVDDAGSLNNRALTFLDLGFPEKAMECWEKAIEKDPVHPAALYNQGLYLWRNGQTEDEELDRRLAAMAKTAPGKADADRLRTQIDREIRNSRVYMTIRCRKPENRNIECEPKPQACLSTDGQTLYTAWDAVERYSVGNDRPEYSKTSAIGDTFAAWLALTPDGKNLLLAKQHIYKLDAKPDEPPCLNPGEAQKLWVLSSGDGEVRRMTENEYTIKFILSHPDGIHFYTAGCDNPCAGRWNLETGELEQKYTDTEEEECTANPYSLSLSPDGTKLFVLSRHLMEYRLLLWDEATGRLIRAKTMKKAPDMLGACFSPDGKQIITCGKSGFLVWDTDTLDYREVNTCTQLEEVWPAGDGTRLITRDIQQHVKLWDTATLQCLCVFPGHERKVTCINTTPDLKRLVTTDARYTVRVWDVDTEFRRAPWELSRIRNYGEIVAQLSAVQHRKGRIRDALAEGRVRDAIELLEAGEKESGIFEYISQRREIMRRCGRELPTELHDLYFSEIVDKDMYHTFELFGWAKPCFHPTENLVFLRYAFDTEIQVWRDTGGKTGAIGGIEEYNLQTALAASPDGNWIAIGGEGGIRLYDPMQKRPPLNLATAFRTKWHAVTFSPDGRLVAAYGDIDAVNIWNTATGKQENHIMLRCQDEKARDACFLQGGRQIALLYKNELRLLDSSTGKQLQSADTGCICRYFLPGGAGNRLYAATPAGVLVWDTENWRKIRLIQPCPPEKFFDEHCYCLSPDGRVLAAAHENTVMLLSMEGEGRTLLEVETAAPAKSMAFSPDGSILCAVCENTAFFWEVHWKPVYPGEQDWDERADGPVNDFMESFPDPDKEQVQLLLRKLENIGLGYIRPSEVRKRVARKGSRRR